MIENLNNPYLLGSLITIGGFIGAYIIHFLIKSLIRYFKSRKIRIKALYEQQRIEKEAAATLLLKQSLIASKKAKKEPIIEEKIIYKEHNLAKRKKFNMLIIPNLRGILQWWNERKHPHRMFLIRMEYKNGFISTFLVKEIDNQFRIGDNSYIIDPKQKYYDISSRYYCLDYFEGISLPIKRILNVKPENIKKSVEITDKDIYYGLNPKVLRDFIKSKITEGLLAGSALDRAMSILKIIGFITLLVALMTFGLLLYSSGVFSGLKGAVT